MANVRPSPCARCSHPLDSHVEGVCRVCWEQEQRWARVRLTPPTHVYADPDIPEDVERAKRETVETTQEALRHLLRDRE
jgi:hypothetical protein